MKYGYARVSSVGQDLTIQVEALTNAGCETIRQEKVSGTSVQGRDELNTLLEFLRDGDELVVTPVLIGWQEASVTSKTSSMTLINEV